MADDREPVRPQSKPVLIRTDERRAQPSGLSAADEVAKLASLAHELRGLLDGSLRNVNMLLRARRARETPPAINEDEDSQLRLESIRTALAEMTQLVQRTLGPSQRRFALRLGGLTLGDAVAHGCIVIDALAQDAGVRIDCEVDPRVAGADAGPGYTVVVNGVRNAIESLRRSPSTDRRVEVRAGVELERGVVVLSITDNGPGLPPDRRVSGERRTQGPFDPGFTTKADGTGLGLPFCREVVREAGGRIELRAGANDQGAELRAEWPMPA